MKGVEFDAYGVDLHSVLVWAIQEQRLFARDKEDMEFHNKLDGRPLESKSHFVWMKMFLNTIFPLNLITAYW